MAETEAGTADIALAAFFSLNEKGVYNLLSRDGYLAVYSGSETDFEIGAAKAQNETFLLKASAGNLYQHSTTGVGLVDYLHSSLENNGLAAKLQSEFLSDKVVIKNAYMDSATGELLLETEERRRTMGKYRVVAGQNIYDVALYLYGSIEGVVDLLINNPDLSFATTLTAGRELVYTDDFVIRADVVAYNGLHGIVPANGERHVYPKTFTLPLAVVLTLAAGIITVQCAVSGAGQLEIDWATTATPRPSSSRTRRSCSPIPSTTKSGTGVVSVGLPMPASGVSTGAGSNRGRWYWCRHCRWRS